MSDILELLEKQADVFEKFRKSHDERYKQLDKFNMELEAKVNRLTLGSNVAGNKSANNIAEHKAIGAFVKTGDETELKTLSVGNDPSGGYLVVPQLSDTIKQKIWDQSPMRRLATIQPIDGADSWEEPVDFSDVGAVWTGEHSARSETDNPELKFLKIDLKEIYAHQKVTQKLLDLSHLDIGAWIEGKIADKFGRSEGAAYVLGDGIAKPRGFLDLPTDTADDSTRAWGKLQYVATGVDGDFAPTSKGDKIKDLFWSLRAPYRQNSTWLMNSATACAVDKFKDGQGDYIWRPGIADGQAPTLLGRPVEIDENMPAIDSNSFSIALGDFRQGYKIIDWPGIKFLRDPFTSKPNVVVYAYRRTGGDVDNSEAIKLLKFGTS